MLRLALCCQRRIPLHTADSIFWRSETRCHRRRDLSLFVLWKSDRASLLLPLLAEGLPRFRLSSSSTTLPPLLPPLRSMHIHHVATDEVSYFTQHLHCCLILFNKLCALDGISLVLSRLVEVESTLPLIEFVGNIKTMRLMAMRKIGFYSKRPVFCD